MKFIYIVAIFGLIGCTHLTPHEKSLQEIHDLKEMGDQIEMEGSQLIKENTRVIEFQFR